MSAAVHATRLHGIRLTLARVGWFVVLVVTLGLYAAAAPLRIAEWGRICFAVATCDATRQLSPGAVQELAQRGLSIETYVALMSAMDLAFTLTFILIATLIFWRRSDDWMAILVSVMLITFSVFLFTAGINPLAERYPALIWLNVAFQMVGATSLVLFFFLFPDGRFVPPWVKWLAPIFIAREMFNLLEISFVIAIVDILFLVELLTFLALQIYRYRFVSTPLQRQQTKWVVLGIGTALSVFVLVFVYYSSSGAWPQAGIPSLAITFILDLALTLLPISIAIAILRSRLWDIDILIRRTVTYALVTALLVVVFFVSVVVLQQVFAIVTDTQQNELVTVISTLAIAALFVPLRNKIQDLIDRRFYRKKYDAQLVLQSFGESVRDETDLEHLTGRLMAVVNETMQPKSMSIWLYRDKRGDRA